MHSTVCVAGPWLESNRIESQGPAAGRATAAAMDAARKKALVRSRMKQAAQQREKRIDSPLVRYNELGQPVCKVCNVAVRSESLWPAHLVSRQHKEAAEDIKARAKAAGLSSGAQPPIPAEPVRIAKVTPPVATAAPAGSGPPVPGTRTSSALPVDFFDAPDAKRIRSSGRIEKGVAVPQEVVAVANESPQADPVEGKGSLPEGFFDSVPADHKARGKEPPKADLNDEWKEFQKSIQDDLKEVDYRQEEEEYDAAEEREAREELERRTLMLKVDMFRKKQEEKAAALAAAVAKEMDAVQPEEEDPSGSDDDSEEDTYYVDWRAKHL